MSLIYYVGWAATISIGSFYVGYALLELSILWDLIPGIYGTTFEDRQIMNRWIYRMSPLGAAFTAIATGALMHKGKRNLLLFSNLIVLIAGGVNQIQHISALFIVRILRGFVLGIQNTIGPI